VTSAERARDLKKPPVLIRSVAQAVPPDARAGMMFSSLVRDDITDLAWRQVADTLWRRGGVGPSDVDVAQLYDCFTISVLLQLESFGFCKRGESGSMATSGVLARGGEMPINTGGGHLSEGYIHGMNHVVQAVRQLRGEADMQILDAELSLVTGGPLPISSALLLRRDS
jgi:acetyl-CoA acetyltransferase